jgi:hypothetical protein
MPTYAQQWQNVWNPYVTYAQQGNPAQVKGSLEEFYLSQVLGVVDAPFLTDIDAYRNDCRNLKQNPTDGTIANRVQTKQNSLITDAKNFFQPRAETAQRRLKGATEAIGKAKDRGLIQGDEHTKLLKTMVLEIVLISQRLKDDQEKYSARKIAQTLDQVRLNS